MAKSLVVDQVTKKFYSYELIDAYPLEFPS